MEPKMSQITRSEVLARKRDRYARAGKEHKTKIINELAELFGCHRKAAIRALQARPVLAAPFIRGSAPGNSIRTNCARRSRLFGCPLTRKDPRRLQADVRQALLEASRATLDRLLIPARIEHRRRATTRPGTLLRHQIPIRTEWTEDKAGILEVDTVALTLR